MTKQYFIQNLFGIQGFNITWYGVIIAFAALLGIIIACKSVKKQGIKEELIIDFIIIALPVSIIGARVYYVLFQWDTYKGNIIKVFATNEGGLAIYGGVLAGVACAYFFSKRKKFPFLKLVDFAVPSLTLGQAIGRWGNYTNQEAFGQKITNLNFQFFPYGVYIDKLQEWHQATFFYESILNIFLFAILIFNRNRKKFDGQLLGIYMIGYGIIRAIIEGFRTDSLYLIPGIRISQVLSVILIISGIVLIFVGKNKLKISEYKGKYSV